MLDANEKERRERVRVKLIVGLLLSYGYALLGGALWQPLVNFKGFTSADITVSFVALGMHGVAYYLAPRGEPK